MAGSKKTVYVNAIGAFLFDSQNKLVDKDIFDSETSVGALMKKEIPSHKFQKTCADAEVISSGVVPPDYILEALRDESLFIEFRQTNILLAKRQIKESFTRDELIVQTVGVLDDLDRQINSMTKRLRDWYFIRSPEIPYFLESYEKFLNMISTMKNKEILSELCVKEDMSAALNDSDIAQIELLTAEVRALYELKKKNDEYLDALMKEVCPNIQAIAGTAIGSKLVSLAGGLYKIAMYPASTVQLLGAEKALFRHLKTGAKPPKFGVIINHALVAKAKKSDRGRIARALADKISIAAKVDLYKGDFIGNKLLTGLENKFR